jgi:hypothetical protein
MQRSYRYLGSLLLSTALITPASLVLGSSVSAVAQDHDDHDRDHDRDHDAKRVYDRDHRDYHNWDDREDRAYRQWLEEKHEAYRDYAQLKQKQQREYWEWRHNHEDHEQH